jgi:stage II sporulation protein P
LVRFKVIRIRSKIIPFVAICLLISIVISFFIMPRIKPKTAVVFNQLKIDKPHIKTPSNLDYIFSKKILSLGLPALDTFEKQKVRLFNLASIPTTAMKLLTNIDINKPESFFALQVPLMSLMKTETTLTPGVEVPQDGDSNLIEDEHNPPEDPPEVPSMELDSKEVDKLVTEQGKPILLIYHTHTSESYTPSKAYNYNPRDNAYHTEDLNFSIAKVGEAMAAELNMLKVPTLHDKTIHDIPTLISPNLCSPSKIYSCPIIQSSYFLSSETKKLKLLGFASRPKDKFTLSSTIYIPIVKISVKIRIKVNKSFSIMLFSLKKEFYFLLLPDCLF